MSRRVGRTELCKGAGRREARLPEVFKRALGALGQAGEAGVLEFLDAECECDVHGTRGDCVHRTAQGFGARGAEVLYTRHRYVRQSKREGQRQARAGNALVLVEHAEPCRLDPVTLDTGVGHGFGERFDHQVVGAAVPPFAEPRAAHANDRNLVANAACHVQLLTGVAFQK